MNILIATDVFPPKSGGSGWSTFHLARALQARRHRVEIVLPKLGAREIQTRGYEGLRVVEVGYDASNLPGIRAWQRTRALEKKLSAYLAERAHEFDLIHAQHILSISAAIAAKKILAPRANIPVLGTVRDYWAVCLYGTLWRDDAQCSICHGSEITKCLAQKYGGAAKFMQPAIPFVERELKRRQRALQDSDAVIAVSEFVADTLRGIVQEKKLNVVPNLIDVEETEREASRAKRDTRNDEPYLMFIGKLNHLKGADLLPEILEKSGVAIPLVVAGDGELREKLAQCNGIDMRGWIPNTETLALLSRAQALVFPSRWAEPLARTLLEAQALGVPTIALNTGGTRDIIRNNFNGLLAANADEFSAYVRRIVSDSELRTRLSENAKRVARKKFSASVVVAQLEKIYEGLTHPSSLIPYP